MLRMEIALFMVMGFIAFSYFTTDRNPSRLHDIFSAILVTLLIHLVFDGITVWTVNHLEKVPRLLNDWCHRCFVGTMMLIFYLFYMYIARMVAEETGRPNRISRVALGYLVLSQVLNLFLPVHYAVTERGNYSDGLYAVNCYCCVGFYFAVCTGLMIVNRKSIAPKKRQVISMALAMELLSVVLQGIRHDWLLSGMGISLVVLSLYLTLENPELLRAELVEQKMSMLYLKSQVNPHFLYNTLDTIRIRARLNGDGEVSDLLMKLVDFYRLSIKVDRQMVDVDDELELLENYLELMCYRYPELEAEYDVDPDLGCVSVPNFILQPIVENSLIHGMKSKGYRGRIVIGLEKVSDTAMEFTVRDSGGGFAPGKKAKVDDMLKHYAGKAPRLEGNSIGILNVQKRIKYLCGGDYGLSYTENEEGGVTAHVLLPLQYGE